MTTGLALATDNTIKIMACSQFTPDSVTHSFLAAVDDFQITANGYTAGGQALAGKAVNVNNTDKKVYFAFNNPEWTIVGTMTAQIFAIYKDTGNPATSPVLFIIDKGAPQSRTDAVFRLQLNGKGLVGLDDL